MLISEKVSEIKLKGFKCPNDSCIDNVQKPLMNWYNFCCLLIGSAGSGKSSLMQNILLSKDMYRQKFDKVYLFSGSRHTLSERFLSKLDQTRQYDDLENLESVVDEIKQTPEKKTLLIFDDVVKELSDSLNKPVLQQICFNRRHMGVSVFFVSQKLNSIPTFIRSSADSIFFWNGNMRKEVEAFFNDFITEDKHDFMEIIRYVFKDSAKHTFLYLNKRDNKFHKNFNELLLE